MNPFLPVTIIIATYNRSVVLKETLESLILHYENAFVTTASEILVIDNNSSDDTREIILNISKKYSFVKYILEDKQGLSHGRNRGIKEAVNENLIFADDDIEVEKGWVEGLINPLLKNPEIGVVGARIVPFGQPVPNWMPSKYFWLVGVRDLGNTERYVDHAMGASMAFRKSIFDEVGLFDPALGRNGKQLLGGEEVDIQKRIMKKGYKILYNPSALVYHKIAPKLNEIYVLKFAYLDGLSTKRIDRKSDRLRYFVKSVYSAASLNIFLPLKRLYSSSIAVNIRVRYFEGYLANE